MLDFIKNIAVSAGKIIMNGYGNVGRIDIKEHAGWVTDIDKRSEDFLIKEIIKNFPESSILAEESGITEGEKGMRWIIDPLDGTSNFAHGFPWFCVSIALELDGELKTGVIYQPVLDELYYAETGSGMYLNGKKVEVSRFDKLETSLLATGFSYLRGEALKREMQRFTQVQQIALGVRRAGSAAMDLAQVACGRFTGFWELGLNPWDVAAGFVMIREAGGTLTDYDGKKTDCYGKNFVVSNGQIHSELLEAIKVI